MIMKQALTELLPRVRRVGVAHAKAHLSEVLRELEGGPTVIHSRGRDVAVILPLDEYDRLASRERLHRAGGAGFLDRVETLKQRHGGGEDFEPACLDLVPADPFRGGRKTRA